MVKLDQAPLLYRGNTMVPLRFVSETMGAAVDYNAVAQRININTSGNSAASKEAVVTLKPNKSIYIPNEPIKIAFTAPAKSKSLYVYAVPSDIPSGDLTSNKLNNVGVAGITSRTQGVLEFRAPTALGSYEFRAQDSERQFSSIPFEVVAKTNEGRRQVWVNEERYNAKDPIIVNFKAVDFQYGKICLVEMSLPRGNAKMTLDKAIHNFNISRATHGSQKIVAPSDPGLYELRMIDNYNNEIAYSKIFSVGVNVTLKPNKEIYIPNEPIKLAFNAPAKHKSLYVYAVPSDSPNGDIIKNKLNHVGVKGINPRTQTQGVLDFRAPTALGTYEFRVQDSELQFSSTSFEVVAKTNEERRKVSVDRPSYKVKEEIRVSFKAVDFQYGKICLVMASLARGNAKMTLDKSIHNFNYARVNRGSQKMVAPGVPGVYELRLIDSYDNEIAYSKPFRVTK